jgi:hypothetical protein
MAKPILLTPAAARALHLHAQGLAANNPRRRAGKLDVFVAIQRMRLLQIDTINVVARSPYLVLFSRLGDYRTEWLDELLAEGAIFETWAHEACFAPMSERLLLRRHLDDKGHHWALRHAERMREEHGEAMHRLLKHVRDTGPVRSADFARGDGAGGGGGWWGWKDEKRWLEAWFALGELMVLRRENFQRVYDLTERVLRNAGFESADHASIDPVDVRRRLILHGLHALGIARAGWIADYHRMRPRVTDDELTALVEQGDAIRVDVRAWDSPAYVHADRHESLALAASNRLRCHRTTLLSPFDPVVWDRDRALAMFDFDYRLECYTPEAKRAHGYFVLPILHQGRLVGRLDAKAHRREHRFEVKRLSFEEGIELTPRLLESVAVAIAECAAWHGSDQVTFTSVRPRSAIVALRRSANAVLA